MSVRKRTWRRRRARPRKLDCRLRRRGRRPAHQDVRAQEGRRRLSRDVKVDVARASTSRRARASRSPRPQKSGSRASRLRAGSVDTFAQYRQHIDLHIVPRIGMVKLAKLTAGEGRGVPRRSPGEPLAADGAQGADQPEIDAEGLEVRPPRRRCEGRRQAKRSASSKPGAISRRLRRVERIINAAKDEQAAALLLTAALTGLRASELRGLRWSDVDLKAGELHVRQRADRYNAIGPPKSGSGTRTIPLAPELLAALKVWQLACPKGEHGLVFPTATGAIDASQEHAREPRAGHGRRWRRRQGGQAEICAARLPAFLRLWCINPGSRGGRELPAKVVQELLGHSSIVMTLDLYGHLFPRSDDRAELAAAASALLG